MQDTHDDRAVPLDPQPESKSLLESILFWLTFGRTRDNKRNERQAKAAEKALRVLGRLGKPEGFASLAALPVIGLACVAILYAVAVLS